MAFETSGPNPEPSSRSAAEQARHSGLIGPDGKPIEVPGTKHYRETGLPDAVADQGWLAPDTISNPGGVGSYVHTEVPFAIPGDLSESAGPITDAEMAAGRAHLEALHIQHNKQPRSLGSKIRIGALALVFTVGAAVGIKAATSSNESTPSNVEPTATAPVIPGTLAPSTVEQGATSVVIESTPAPTSEVGVPASGDMGSSVTTTPETTVSENDPLKGGAGLWDQLSPETQASFNQIAAKNWSEMDPLTYSKEASGKEFDQMATFLYRNNVLDAIAKIRLDDPALASDLEKSVDITVDSSDQKVLDNVKLRDYLAYYIGSQNKQLGRLYLESINFVGLRAYQPAVDAYNSHDFQQDDIPAYETATPLADSIRKPINPTSYSIDFTKVALGNSTGYSELVFVVHDVVNPNTGKTESAIYTSDVLTVQ